MIDLREQHVALGHQLAQLVVGGFQLVVRGLQILGAVGDPLLQFGGERAKLFFRIIAPGDVEVGEEMVGHLALAVIERAGEQHGPERGCRPSGIEGFRASRRGRP